MQMAGDDGFDDLGLARHVACGLDCTYVTMMNGLVRVMGASKYGQVMLKRCGRAPHVTAMRVLVS